MTSINSDMNLLEKYSVGRDIDEIDLPRIYELALIGLMKTGISTKRRQLTAKTTSLGMGFSGNWITRRL